MPLLNPWIDDDDYSYHDIGRRATPVQREPSEELNPRIWKGLDDYLFCI